MKTIYFCLSFILIFTISCSSGDKNQTGTSGSKTNQGIITDDSLLTLVQYRTFQYFWDGAEPNSGMARERFHVDGIYPENDMNVVTTGGSGFGVMAILVGIERDFITREEAYSRFCRIVDFLKKSDRFHGAWSHWIYGETGRVRPFSPKDNGADIVETAYLMQGLLAVRQYFMDGSEKEKVLAQDIDKLWREVEWSWFTKGGEDVLYWHWSPDYGWDMNFAVRGYNEDCWGLTASYSMTGYVAHCPGEINDLGVISPTAALSSFPYTPDQSMNAMKHFYYVLGNKIWGEYGFYDAFSEQNNWFPQRYLAIDQGPAVIMIENYRTGLLWNLFMSCEEIQEGLNALGFTTGEY